MFEGKRQPVVYILTSPNRRALYVGVTTDLERRLLEHRLGLVEHTARYNIRRYVEHYDTRLHGKSRSRAGAARRRSR